MNLDLAITATPLPYSGLDSPVNFKVWMANTESHFLNFGLERWGPSCHLYISLVHLPKEMFCANLIMAWQLPTHWASSSISLFCPTILFLIWPIYFSVCLSCYLPLNPQSLATRASLHFSDKPSLFQLQRLCRFCSLECSSSTCSSGWFLLDITSQQKCHLLRHSLNLQTNKH